MRELIFDYALEGGGAKGAFQAGVIYGLSRLGIRPGRIIGTSVGALNGAGLVMKGIEWLRGIWSRIGEKNVYKKTGLVKVGWRVGVEKKLGLYDWGALYGLLLKELGPGPYGGLRVGTVGYSSGAYYTRPGNARTVFASASMPILAEPVRVTSDEGTQLEWDGGVLRKAPLADMIDAGSDRILLIQCSPPEMPIATDPDDIRDVIARFIETTLEGRSRAELAQTLLINELVKLATEAGAEPRLSPSGVPYRYVPVEVAKSPEPLGETTDFRRDVLDYRFNLGLSVAAEIGPQLFEKYAGANP